MQEIAAAAGTHVVVLGDVDGDGDLDVAATNQSSNSVSVRLNDGTGTFTGTQNIVVGYYPNGLALNDVDGDGDLDMVASTGFDGASVRLNDGTGSFSGTQQVLVGANPAGVCLSDLDGDGDLDLLVTNFTSNTVSIRTNNGTGIFSGTQEVPVGNYPNSLALGDVDSDGDLDFLTANVTVNTVSVRFNQVPLVTPVLTWAPLADVTYGTDLTNQLTAVATVNGTVIAGTYVYRQGTTIVTSATVLGAQDVAYPVRVDFTPASSAYVPVSATNALRVQKADQLLSWATPVAIAYGTALSTTQFNATVAVVTGGSAPGDLTYSPAAGTVLGAGSQSLQVSAAATPNYNAATASVVLAVGKVTLTIQADNKTKLYDNRVFTAFTYTLMGLVNGETSSVLSGTVTYAGAATTAITASPTPYTITPVVSGLSSANYAFVTVAGQLTIAPAPQVIAWTTPTAITYGTALSSTQLKAAVTGVPGGTVPGALVYTPAAGIVLGAGSQTLSVSAAATVNYAAATATVILLVNKAPQVITWNAPRAITYGTALSATQLNAKVVGVTGGTAPGPSTYSPAAGAVLGAGTQLLSVSAAATANYAAATKSVALIVNKAIPTARATGGTFVYTGSPQPGTGTATGVAGAGLSPVRLSYTGTVSPTTAPTMVGSYSVTASFAGDANYLAATSTAVALRITKATATLVLSNLIQTYDGTPKAATVTTSPTGVSGVSVTYALLTNGRAGRASTTPPTALGSYVVTATLSNTNFQASTTTGTLVIRTAAVAKVTVLAPFPESPAPSTGFLFEVYPNPLMERGTLHFHTVQGGKAQVYLYDEIGRRVATLYNADVQSGQEYYLPLQRGELSEGVYFFRLIVNGTVHNLRLNIVR